MSYLLSGCRGGMRCVKIESQLPPRLFWASRSARFLSGCVCLVDRSSGRSGDNRGITNKSLSGVAAQRRVHAYGSSRVKTHQARNFDLHRQHSTRRLRGVRMRVMRCTAIFGRAHALAAYVSERAAADRGWPRLRGMWQAWST